MIGNDNARKISKLLIARSKWWRPIEDAFVHPVSAPKVRTVKMYGSPATRNKAIQLEALTN